MVVGPVSVVLQMLGVAGFWAWLCLVTRWTFRGGRCSVNLYSIETVCGRALVLNLEKVSCDCTEAAINQFPLFYIQANSCFVFRKLFSF